MFIATSSSMILFRSALANSFRNARSTTSMVASLTLVSMVGSGVIVLMGARIRGSGMCSSSSSLAERLPLRLPCHPPRPLPLAPPLPNLSLFLWLIWGGGCQTYRVTTRGRGGGTAAERLPMALMIVFMVSAGIETVLVMIHGGQRGGYPGGKLRVF